MEAIRYSTGEIVKKGDQVVITHSLASRLISILTLKPKGKTEKGTVVGVYDPDQPIIPNGENEYGICIKYPDGHWSWGVPGSETKLKRRN